MQGLASRKIELNSRKFTLVDEIYFQYLSQWKWFYHNGYAERSINLGNNKIKNIKMHRLITGALAGQLVDHINGDKLDNRIVNLRICDSMQNQQNRAVHYNKKFKGVSWHKRILKWQVSIRVNRQLKHVGYFDNEIEAAKQYNFHAIKYFGEFARLNHV